MSLFHPGKTLTKIGAFTIIWTLAACTTTSSGPEFRPAKVIERMEGYEKTPAFATGQKAMWAEGNQIYFANIVSMKGNTRPEACLKIAAIDAKVEMLRHIKERLTNSGQLSVLQVDNDPAYESLTAFLAQGDISGASIEERYYDRREESSETGERLLRLRCAVKLGISRLHLSQLLREATAKPNGNAEIREKLLETQKQFIENL